MVKSANFTDSQFANGEERVPFPSMGGEAKNKPSDVDSQTGARGRSGERGQVGQAGLCQRVRDLLAEGERAVSCTFDREDTWIIASRRSGLQALSILRTTPR